MKGFAGVGVANGIAVEYIVFAEQVNGGGHVIALVVAENIESCQILASIVGGIADAKGAGIGCIGTFNKIVFNDTVMDTVKIGVGITIQNFDFDSDMAHASESVVMDPCAFHTMHQVNTLVPSNLPLAVITN